MGIVTHLRLSCTQTWPCPRMSARALSIPVIQVRPLEDAQALRSSFFFILPPVSSLHSPLSGRSGAFVCIAMRKA